MCNLLGKLVFPNATFLITVLSLRGPSLSLPLFFFFPVFTDETAAYESSQARGQIGAAAEAYTTATAKPAPGHICDLCRSFWQCQILMETLSGP